MKQKASTALICLLPLTGGLALLLALSSCSRSLSFQNSEWKTDSRGTPPRPSSLGADAPAALGLKQIEFRMQEIEGVPIQGSYLKVLNQAGRPLWSKAKYIDEKTLPYPNKVRRELKHRDVVERRMEEYQNTFHCKYTGELKPELRWDNAWNLVFKRECEAANGQALEVIVNSRGRLVSHDAIGAGITMLDTALTLYPDGPKLSQLKTVKLSIASTPGFLVNPAIEVVSDGGFKFTDADQVQRSVPGDEGFDMLQAYYYATRASEWVAQHLKYQLQGLKLRTDVGYPDKSNVAFYFNHQVRIGTGDDVTFSHMAWDPSLVTHESMHAVIEALTHLPLGTGEGGSLQEGLADFLTALQLDDPQIGESSTRGAPYQRTLDNNLKLTDKTGGLYHDSLIFSGTLWEIKQKVDPATAEELAVFMLEHLAPSSNFDDVKTQFAAWVESELIHQKTALVETILRQRGWL